MSAETQSLRFLLDQARQALHRGDREEARRLAERITRLAPNLEEGWLILNAAADSQWSRHPVEQMPGLQAGSPPVQGAVARSRPRVRRASGDVEAGPGVRKESLRRVWGWIGGLVLLGCMVLGLAAGAVFRSSAWMAVTQSLGESGGEDRSFSNFRPAYLPKPTYTPAWIETGTVASAWNTALLPTPTVALGSGQMVESPEIPAPVEPFPLAETSLPIEVFSTEALPTEVSILGDSTETLEPVATPTLIETFLPAETPTPTAESWLETPTATDVPGVMEAYLVPDTPTPARPTPMTISSAGKGGHWILVDLSEQRLYAYEGDEMVNVFVVSTGVAATPTVTGSFRVYARYRYADMRGPGYYLPDVPYVMYFYKSYGIHGTYWHNNFGRPMSHGCVNMRIPDAEWLYNWSTYGTLVVVQP